MTTQPLRPPRFLPTLTEVVKPPELSLEGCPVSLETEALRQTVMLQLDALVQARVHQELDKLVRTVIHERAEELIDGLKIDLEQEIKKLVAHAVDAQRGLNNFNS